MKTSIYNKLTNLATRYTELGKMLSDPEVIADQKRYRSFAKEYSHELLAKSKVLSS